MFPNEMEFYHFLSPRDSFRGQVTGRVEAWPPTDPPGPIYGNTVLL